MNRQPSAAAFLFSSPPPPLPASTITRCLLHTCTDGGLVVTALLVSEPSSPSPFAVAPRFAHAHVPTSRPTTQLIPCCLLPSSLPPSLPPSPSSSLALLPSLLSPFSLPCQPPSSRQSLTSDAVIAAQDQVAQAAQSIVVFGPTADGVELPDLPWNLAAKGAFSNRVPLLLVRACPARGLCMWVCGCLLQPRPPVAGACLARGLCIWVYVSVHGCVG
jgi:hypothetical protein